MREPERTMRRLWALWGAVLASLALLSYAAGPKAGGNVTVTDDLPVGSTGSRSLSNGSGLTAEGGLGQVAASSASAAGYDAESGYFSRLVYQPATLSSTSFGTSSVTFTWTDAIAPNPAGTQYAIEVSSAPDFSGTIVSSAAYSPTAAAQGLLGNTTYYGRIKALYMEGDESGYKFDPLDAHLTLAYAPSTGRVAGFGARSGRLAWDGRQNFGGDPGTWSAAGPALPLARQNHAVAASGRRLYLSGGVNGGVASEVYVASIAADGTTVPWALSTPLPAPRHSHAMAVWRDALYVAGGFDGAARATVWFAPILADGSVGDWRTTTPLPSPRYRHAMAASNGRLYVLGGDNGVTAQNTVFYADILADGSVGPWTQTAGASQLPNPVSGHSLAVSSGSLYVAGGVTTGVSATALKSDLDPVTGAPGGWSAVTSLPTPLTQGALVAGDSRLFWLGGNNGAGPVAAVYSVPIQPDMTLGAWTTLPALAAPVFAVGAARVSDRLFAVGGSDGALPLQTAQVAVIKGTEYLTERATKSDFSAGLVDGGWRTGTEFEFDSLAPNTTYFFRTRARNAAGVTSATLDLGSTTTLAAVPAPALSTFTSVDVGSIGVQWSAGLNPAGTLFRVQLATSPDFTTPSSPGWAAPTSALFAGLSVNASYYFRVQAQNVNLLATPFLPLGAVFTLSSAPVGSRISAARSDGFTLEWSTGNLPAWTRYEAQASTVADFSTLAASSVTLSSTTLFSGLPSAATFYARVRSLNGNAFPSAFDAAVSTRTTNDTTPPGVSTGAFAFPGAAPGSVQASWFAPGNDGAVGDLPVGSAFYVQWSSRPPAGVFWSTAAAQLAIATGPVKAGAPASAVLTGLPLESTVTLRVWTQDQAGNYSLPSDTFTAFSSPFALTRLDAAPADVGLSPSIAVDRFGNVHLAYRGAAGDVRYLRRTGAVWGGLDAPDPGVIAAEVQVAVDNDGNPQVAYRDAGVARLKLARYNGAWSPSIVEPGDFRLGGLALDAEGRAALSYQDAAGGLIKIATFTGVGWSTASVSAGGRVSALALDATEVPDAVFSDDAGSRLVLASRGLTLDNGVVVASRPAVAIDAGDVRWFAYVDALASRLKVGSVAPGGVPSVSVIDDALASGGIALDGAGRPFVAYQGLRRELKYARFTGVAWTTGTIDAEGVEGPCASIALDGAGSVLIAYYDAGRGRLRLAQWTSAVAPAAGGNAAGRAMAPSALAGSALAGLPTSLQWSWTDNAVGELGFRLYGARSSTGPFTLIMGTATIGPAAGQGQTVSVTETGLATNTTYFRYIVVVTSGGVAASRIASAYPFNAVDVTSPTIANAMAGGDGVWRSTSGVYNVHFFDTGGSKLDRFEVRASTVPGGLGPDLVGASTTPVVTGINANAYTTDWALPAAFFNKLWESATNYITINVYDGSNNRTTLVDAFFVRKDTTPPTLVDNQPGDASIRRAGGTLYAVGALDSASGLAAFQYSASTTPASMDGGVIGWTDIAAVANSTSYAANWPVAFNGLPSEVTSYISVRAWDVAGTTRTLADAFYVVKDTSGPSVAISTPAAAFVSALLQLSGTAKDPSGVAGTELSIQQDPPGGLYWTGSAFSNASPVYVAAAGLAAWTLAPAVAWQDGRQYRVVARSSDTPGNYSSTYSTATFTFDASPPTVAVQNPVPGSAISALPVLSGTANDALSGVASVELRLRRNTDGQWWDWAAERFGLLAVSSVATGTNNWSLTPSALLKANLASSTSYFIAVRALDAAAPANAGDFFAKGATFTYSDTTPPAAITNLFASSSSVSGRIDLSWSAPGNDGNTGIILNGQFRIMFATDAAVNFSTTAAQVTISTSFVSPGDRESFAVLGLIGGSTYFLRAWTQDGAGNWSAVSNAATALAGPRLYNQISGHVVKTSSEGITAVLVQAFNASDVLVASSFTFADGSGTYLMDNLPAGSYKVQATWSADGIASSVWQDGIAMGSGNVDFVLEVRYTLATLTGTLGTLAAPQGRLTSSGQTLGSAAGGYHVAAAQGSNFSASKVELFAGGRRAVEVAVNPAGRWTIPNLLPGKYGVRAFNGISYTDILDVEVGEGELKDVSFVYNALPEHSVFAFPNPAGRETTFRFESPLLPLEAQVSVFDLNGNLVREIEGASMTAAGPGLYHAPWDLRNMRGEPIASGVYLFMVKVKGGNPEQTAKVVKKLAVVR